MQPPETNKEARILKFSIVDQVYFFKSLNVEQKVKLAVSKKLLFQLFEAEITKKNCFTSVWRESLFLPYALFLSQMHMHTHTHAHTHTCTHAHTCSSTLALTNSLTNSTYLFILLICSFSHQRKSTFLSFSLSMTTLFPRNRSFLLSSSLSLFIPHTHTHTHTHTHLNIFFSFSFSPFFVSFSFFHLSIPFSLSISLCLSTHIPKEQTKLWSEGVLASVSTFFCFRFFLPSRTQIFFHRVGKKAKKDHLFLLECFLILSKR